MQILIGWLGRAISFVLFRGPLGQRKAIANFLAFLWFDLFRIRRQVVLDNLHIAFPEMSLSERVRVGRESVRNLGMTLLEYSFLPWLTKENYSAHFEFDNIELFDELLKRGRGVIFLTAHVGNGDLSLAALSLRGYPIVLVSKEFKIKWLNDMWFGMRRRVGTRFVAARNSTYALLKALKQASVVVFPLDQFTGPPIGVRTKFFGKETGTAAGMAVMAERSGTPVLAVYTHRKPDGRHLLHFVREMPVVKGESLEVTTQTFNDELERYVRMYPEQWMWIHRRWKTFEVT